MKKKLIEKIRKAMEEDLFNGYTSDAVLYEVCCMISDMPKEPKKLVGIVERWSANNPIKTRQDKFLEQYPEVVKDEHGIINIAPCVIERSRFMKNDKSTCNTPEKLCRQCREEYWREEIE